MPQMLIQTDEHGRVTLRHYNSDAWDSMDGTVVDQSTIPAEPDFRGAGAALYYTNGSFEYKLAGRYPKEQSGDVQGLRKWMKGRAKRIRDEVATGNVQYDGHEWASDAESRQTLLEVLQGGQIYNQNNSDTFTVTWITQSGARPDTTVSDLQAVVAKIRQLRQPAYTRYGELIQNLDAANTITDLNAIDVTTGW